MASSSLRMPRTSSLDSPDVHYRPMYGTRLKYSMSAFRWYHRVELTGVAFRSDRVQYFQQHLKLIDDETEWTENKIFRCNRPAIETAWRSLLVSLRMAPGAWSSNRTVVWLLNGLCCNAISNAFVLSRLRLLSICIWYEFISVKVFNSSAVACCSFLSA